MVSSVELSMASRSQSQAELEKVGKEGFAIIDKYFYGRPRRPPEVRKVPVGQTVRVTFYIEVKKNR